MKIIIIDDFIDNDMLIEKNFRKKIKEHDWLKYKNQNILIKGCSQYIIPTWAYLIIISKVLKLAKNIYYGDVKSPVMISKQTD